MPEVIKVVDVKGDDLKALEFKPEGLAEENKQLTKLLEQRKDQIQATLKKFRDRTEKKYTSFISDNEEAFNQALRDYADQLNKIIRDFGNQLKRIAEKEKGRGALTVKEELIKMDPGYELVKAIREHFNSNISNILDAAEKGGVAVARAEEKEAEKKAEEVKEPEEIYFEEAKKAIKGGRHEKIKKATRG